MVLGMCTNPKDQVRNIQEEARERSGYSISNLLIGGICDFAGCISCSSDLCRLNKQLREKKAY